MLLFFFFFNDTATTEIYTLSLHDALPIFTGRYAQEWALVNGQTSLTTWDRMGYDAGSDNGVVAHAVDRKSTRLNSSHSQISYAVFCLKKKKLTTQSQRVYKPTTATTSTSA